MLQTQIVGKVHYLKLLDRVPIRGNADEIDANFLQDKKVINVQLF